MKDYIFILVAVIVVVLKMVEANKKQKAEAARRAEQQGRYAREAQEQQDTEFKGGTVPEAPLEESSIPTFEEIFGIPDPSAPSAPPTASAPSPAPTPAPRRSFSSASPAPSRSYREPALPTSQIPAYQEEAQSLEDLTPEYTQLPRLPEPQTSVQGPSLEDLRKQGPGLHAAADNAAWQLNPEDTSEEAFDLRTAVIYSALLHRPETAS